MRIVLAGGTGFLGRALQTRLAAARHDVVVLTRQARPGEANQQPWRPDGTPGPWAALLDGADAVVNLAGEGIVDRRWSPARKTALRESRLLATRSVVSAIKRAARPPATLINASGVGYYGDRGDETVTEGTSSGRDFLAELAIAWEHEAEQAASISRVALVRSGVVLHPSGGALARMLLPFRLGFGGRLGSGRQYFPWIHLDDWIGLVLWLLATPAARGAFNATAPHPVTNAEFTRALGRALRRPAVVPVPAFALRIALGELADTLLTGQRAVPARAVDMGYVFGYPEIDQALRALL